MPDVSFVFAFLGGLISFVTPCVLPLVPAYISIMSGVSLEELRSETSSRTRSKIVFSAIAFILGFSVVFVMLGAVATFIGDFLQMQKYWFRLGAGTIIIVFGLHLTGVFRIKFLLYEQRINKQQSKAGYISTFFIGMAFAFGWSPCLGPILSGILGIAAMEEHVMRGILLLSVYSLGLGIPFLLTALATNYCIGIFNRIKKHLRRIEIASGILVIVIGLLIITNKFTLLANYINQLLPFLQKIG